MLRSAWWFATCAARSQLIRSSQAPIHLLRALQQQQQQQQQNFSGKHAVSLLAGMPSRPPATAHVPFFANCYACPQPAPGFSYFKAFSIWNGSQLVGQPCNMVSGPPAGLICGHEHMSIRAQAEASAHLPCVPLARLNLLKRPWRGLIWVRTRRPQSSPRKRKRSHPRRKRRRRRSLKGRAEVREL